MPHPPQPRRPLSSTRVPRPRESQAAQASAVPALPWPGSASSCALRSFGVALLPLAVRSVRREVGRRGRVFSFLGAGGTADVRLMVGKREMDCKNPMRRTTSMTEFAPPDALAAVAEDEEEVQLPDNSGGGGGGQDWLSTFGGGAGGAAAQEDWLAAYRARAAPARAGMRRNSADYSVVETAAFLRACGLCRRRLGPGRDTFMYKGEAAFCSLECRERHITQEEWKDKCGVKSIKDAAAGAAAPAPAVTGRRAGSGKPGAGGTVAAA